MTDKAEADEQTMKEIKRRAEQTALTRARTARWDLDVAIFLFVVLILVMVLLFQGIGIEVVAPIAIFGLTCVWLVGWQRGRKLYRVFYEEELIKLKWELMEKAKKEDMVQKTIEETIEEHVQRVFRERWGKARTAN